MKKLRIYLDTSVISFLFADDAPEKRDVTREFFERVVRAGTCEVYVSSIVVDEIKRTHDLSTRQCLLDVLASWNFHHLANIRKEARIGAVNTVRGYHHPLRITTPHHLLSHE